MLCTAILRFAPSPQNNFQGDSTHKALRSAAFVSVHLYHTGEQFTKKHPQIATDYTQKFRKQSILLPNSIGQLTNKRPFIPTWTKRISETTTKPTQKPPKQKTSKFPKPAHTSFQISEVFRTHWSHSEQHLKQNVRGPLQLQISWKLLLPLLKMMTPATGMIILIWNMSFFPLFFFLGAAWETTHGTLAIMFLCKATQEEPHTHEAHTMASWSRGNIIEQQMQEVVKYWKQSLASLRR